MIELRDQGAVERRAEARERRFQERGRCFGGKSSSSSSANQSTTNIDRRQVVDGGSVGIAEAHTVNITDGGTVRAVLDLARGVDELQSQDYARFLDLTGDVFEGALQVLNKNTELAAATAQGVGDAYEVAQSTVSGARDQQKVLLIIGAVVLALVVFKVKG